MNLLTFFAWWVLIAACITAIFSGVRMMDNRAMTRAEPQRINRNLAVATAARPGYGGHYDCAPDGVAITSLDKVRSAALIYDRLLTHGDLQGRVVGYATVLQAAQLFVQDFGDAERGAFLMEQCLGMAAHDYPQGYNLLLNVFHERARHG